MVPSLARRGLLHMISQDTYAAVARPACAFTGILHAVCARQSTRGPGPHAALSSGHSVYVACERTTGFWASLLLANSA